MSDKLNKVLIDKLIENEKLEEMANIQPSRTGISSVLYATFDGVGEGYKHGARVKVKTNSGRIPIQLEPSVKVPSDINVNKLPKEDINKIKEAVSYIKFNKDLFMQHWNGEIDDATLILELEKRK